MEPTETYRTIFGIICFVVAGAQLTMRFTISRYFDDTTRKRSAEKERTLSMSLMFLLTGIGLGNLTHPHVGLTLATLLVVIGTGYATWAIVDLWRWGQEEEANAEDAARHRRFARRPRRNEDDA